MVNPQPALSENLPQSQTAAGGGGGTHNVAANTANTGNLAAQSVPDPELVLVMTPVLEVPNYHFYVVARPNIMLMKPNLPVSDVFSVNFTRNSDGGNNNGQRRTSYYSRNTIPICRFCNLRGHNVDVCYKKNGFPRDYFKFNRPRYMGSTNQNSAPSSVTRRENSSSMPNTPLDSTPNLIRASFAPSSQTEGMMHNNNRRPNNERLVGGLKPALLLLPALLLTTSHRSISRLPCCSLPGSVPFRFFNRVGFICWFISALLLLCRARRPLSWARFMSIMALMSLDTFVTAMGVSLCALIY